MDDNLIYDPLSEREIEILLLFVKEQSYFEIANSLNINISEIERLFSKLKAKWSVKGEVGLCAETIRRGYCDFGDSMEYTRLNHWIQRVDMTVGLKNSLLYYQEVICDAEPVVLAKISKSEFYKIPRAGKQKWNEFIRLRSEISEKLRALNKDYSGG